MSKAAKVAVSLPEDVLEAVERERLSSGESRSQFFRRAVEALLRARREREMAEQYVRAYTELPETQEEVESARHASDILAGEPW